MLDVQNTEEAAYVRTMKWDFDGITHVANNLSESTKDKLKAVFDRWGIGYYASRNDTKGYNLFVPDRQFKRVKFSFQLKKAEEPK